VAGVPFGTIDDAVAWARRYGGRWSAALVRGLVSDDEPPLAWPDDLAEDDTSDEQKRRAALLGGAILRRRIRAGAGYPEAMLLADIAYGAAFGTPQGQRCLRGSPLDPIKAHAYACILAERHGHSIDEANEIELFTWLLDHLGIEPDPELIARMGRQRVRRHERLASR
jgi:hypothetical protein